VKGGGGKGGWVSRHSTNRASDNSAWLILAFRNVPAVRQTVHPQIRTDGYDETKYTKKRGGPSPVSPTRSSTTPAPCPRKSSSRRFSPTRTWRERQTGQEKEYAPVGAKRVKLHEQCASTTHLTHATDVHLAASRETRDYLRSEQALADTGAVTMFMT